MLLEWTKLHAYHETEFIGNYRGLTIFMRAFLFHESDTPSDYDDIRLNGMWYQEWQGGYEDLLRRGHPRPEHKTTILAELFSPETTDFLHGGDGNVPILVSERAKKLMRGDGLTGFRFSRVEVVKIATKGKRKRTPRHGEPADQITKAKDQAGTILPPRLHAVRVIGRLEVNPDFPSGRCPGSDCVTPFDLPKTKLMPDLWRPTINGRPLGGWAYCSQRFRDVIIEHGLSNIAFEPFENQMDEFRRGVEYFAEIRRRASHKA